MESRALAEYARCIRPERLNLALRRNIPDTSLHRPRKDSRKRPHRSEAKLEPLRGKTGAACSPYRAIDVAARPDVAASVRSPKNFRDHAEKRSAPKTICPFGATPVALQRLALAMFIKIDITKHIAKHDD
ncbi:hypothetical protein [Rhizobium laguerreae]|uniref:hypothetical protein n=1 Tax=Rhizobium laguerreae TaxID=1076926 RepID=UPI001C923AAC|nr:hypothetical protein [Rhizobium laguerreae]MBY3385122.1 hypothetical protein [Rhizobium laguerreae]MBY3398783.1 hypothetical protein [Rhizobium laguerreae]MBY3405721.1 hypothetical protein [Rhizobium laguerreae]